MWIKPANKYDAAQGAESEVSETQFKSQLKKMSPDIPLWIFPQNPILSHKYIYAATERTNS